MSDLFRDAPIGQIIRYLSGGKLLKYPEEIEGWTCPNTYHQEVTEQLHPGLEKIENSTQIANEKTATEQTTDASPSPEARDEVDSASSVESHESLDMTKVETAKEGQADDGMIKVATSHPLGSAISRVGSRIALEKSVTLADLDAAITASALQKGPTEVIIPEKLDDGTILVDWYDTDDPANPHNWSLGKKVFVTFQISVYTTAVYMGSSIYAASEPGVIEQFGVSPTAASLGLSLYVLAYGIGPMIWSPLSEIPAIGRNPPYMITFTIFVILCVPTALVNDFAGLLVLRFLQGFFGSPCLATGGASLQDMFSLIKVPYVLCIWTFGALCGPALAPIISGFSVPAEDWHWSLWEMLWLGAPILILLYFCLPETYTPNILYQRAKRLRKLTGNPNLKSQGEIDQGNIKIGALIAENVWRPNQIMILDPAVGFTALYTALIYGIYYSFFEAFPLTFGEIYHFNGGEEGLTFISILIGGAISIGGYCAWLWYYVEPKMKTVGVGAPEERLVPAMLCSIFLPPGLFLYGWTSRESIHWIVSIIGILLFSVGVIVIMQCIFIYLAFCYPQYAASLFAGNDLARSTLAAGAILFSRPMFLGMGIGPGCSLLGGLTAACAVGLFALWYFGASLRARSKFTAK